MRHDCHMDSEGWGRRFLVRCGIDPDDESDVRASYESCREAHARWLATGQGEIDAESYNTSTKATTMTDLDPEPSVGTIVTDRDGELWRREPYGWTFELSPGRWDTGAGISWRNLQQHYGPVKVADGR